MANDLRVINPCSFEGWDYLLSHFQEKSFFHTTNWAHTLVDSYGFKPVYCSILKNDYLGATIPLMEVINITGRKNGVSLPFSDFCQPLFDSPELFNRAFELAVEKAIENKWHKIIIRGNAPFSDDIQISDYYYRHLLTLTKDEDEIFRSFRSNTRRNIKKALTSNISVSFENGFDAIEQFYRLNCSTRRIHGLPPQPHFFFSNLYHYIIEPGHGEIALARLADRVVSAYIFLFFDTAVSYKYGASDRRFMDTCANYLLMWESIRRYRGKKYKAFCFGRTEKSHLGLLQFKKGWGTEQMTIKNYTYKVHKGEFVRSPLKTSGIHNSLFRLMPIPILKALGHIFYRFMG